MFQRSDSLVRAGRVLDQEHENRLAVALDPLETPEGRTEALETVSYLAERRTEGQRQRSGSERVVDVVETGEGESHVNAALRSRERERGALEPLELHVGRTDVERRPRVAAGGAAVVAEVTDVGRRVVVGVPADDAVLGVGRVLQCRTGLARVVEAVDDRSRARARELAELRIVAVHDERRNGVELLDGASPALGHELELPVAVELVAEQVAEEDRARAHATRDLRQCSLVDLEQAELGTVSVEQGRRDTRDEICSRAVPGQSGSAGEDPRQHCARRRLAVRRRHECSPLRQSGGKASQRGGIEPPEQLAGQRRAAASSGKARKTSDRACGGDLGG